MKLNNKLSNKTHVLMGVKTVKIVFENGSVINCPETIDTQAIRGQGVAIWVEVEENEENDVSE